MKFFSKSFTLSWIALACVSIAHASPDKPNVVLIYADDMGYGEIEALNPKRCKVPTPSLNQLAAEGVVFTDAHTTSSVCSPSRYSLLTGRYNWRTRLQSGVLQDGGEPLISADRMTLGALFQGQGYKTAMFGKWHLAYNYALQDGAKQLKRKKGARLAKVPIGTKILEGPLTRGFDTFYGFHHARSMESIVQDDTLIQEISSVEVLPAITKAAVDYIDANAKAASEGTPFFLYFPLSSPHTPILPAPEWIGKSGIGTYGDFVAQTDDSVGAVMNALERNGLTKNTIVIFSADNGTSPAAKFAKLAEKGHFPSGDLRGAKSDLWDGGHRVPFILRWPEIVKGGSSSDQLISLGDLFATFADFFNVTYGDHVAEDSISFLPTLHGKPNDTPRKDIVHHSIKGHFAIRQGPWKLLLSSGSGGWSKMKKPSKDKLPSMQLYHMDRDIGEQQNLVAEHPEKVASLLALLENQVAAGRSTPGETQKNDVEVHIRKSQKR